MSRFFRQAESDTSSRPEQFGLRRLVEMPVLFVIFFWNYQAFTMPEVNTKTQNIVSTISAESILIAVGFNWIQTRSLFVKR